MAKIKGLISHTLSGTIGPVVVATWKGIPYIRRLPVIENPSSTQAQLKRRAAFACAVKFLQPMTSLLSMGFRDYTAKMSGFNYAVSYTLKNSIVGIHPDYSISYSDARVTQGDLPNAVAPYATAGEVGEIIFHWEDNTGIGIAKAADMAILVAYCQNFDCCYWKISDAGRSTRRATLRVPLLRGQVVQTWLAFVSEDDKNIATSIFAGELTVS